MSDLILAMDVLTSAEYGPTDASAQATAWPDPAGVRVGSLRVGLYDHDGWFPASPAIRRAVAEAGAALADRGATVVTFRPPAVEPALTLFIAAAGADGLRTMRRVLRDEPVDPHLKGFLAVSRTPRPLRPVLAAVLDAAGRPHYALPVRASGPWSPAQMARLRDELERYVTGFGAALDASGVDVLISPPFAVPALTHGAGVDLTAHTAGSYATLYSTLGLPSGVVPITRVRAGEESDRPSSGVLSRAARDVETGSAGLPVGVQIAARAWRDDLVLAVMAALESDLVARAEYPRTPVA